MEEYQEYINSFLNECRSFENGHINDFGWVKFKDEISEKERVEIFRYLQCLKPEYAKIMTLISYNGQPASIHIHFYNLT